VFVDLFLDAQVAARPQVILDLDAAANPFERRFRDIHTVSQQLQGRQQHFETVGQYLLGLAPDTAWL